MINLKTRKLATIMAKTFIHTLFIDNYIKFIFSMLNSTERKIVEAFAQAIISDGKYFDQEILIFLFYFFIFILLFLVLQARKI